MDDLTFQQNNERFKACSFCQIPRQGVSTVILGQDACICPNCTIGTYSLMIKQTDIRSNLRIIDGKQVFNSLKSIIALIIALIVLTVILFFVYKK